KIIFGDRQKSSYLSCVFQLIIYFHLLLQFFNDLFRRIFTVLYGQHFVHIVRKEEVRKPHKTTADRSPQPMWSHQHHAIDEGFAFYPHQTSERTAVHQRNRIQHQAHQSKPKMSSHSNLQCFTATETWYYRINTGPNEKTDDTVHRQMRVCNRKIGEMPNEIRCAKGLCRTLQ